MTVDPQRHPSPPCRHRRRRRLRGAAIAVAGAALVGTGAYSGWDGTTKVDSGTLAAGVVTPALLDVNGGTFTTGISNLLPGDFFYRYVDVRNAGSAPSTFTGSVTVTGGLTGYVQVEAATCTVAWVGTSCAGTPSTLGTGTPTALLPFTFSHGTIGSGALAAQHVRYKFTFVDTAPLTLQGATGTISAAVSNTVVGGLDRTGG
ncbi:hypothetical protein TEK04_11470 [Klenkia sp. LSe6-5]|uniref:SipW-cognate class signal peptide n=1 Tax=Klenkia sesuvii TaxID=3103137 RepID=A0ABU8DV42_9ACTN